MFNIIFFIPCGTCMTLPSSLYLCLREAPSEREQWQIIITEKEKINTHDNYKSLNVICHYWVALRVRGVMHSPPVCCPFPCIPHHVVQTKSIGRKGHHLQGIRAVLSLYCNVFKNTLLLILSFLISKFYTNSKSSLIYLSKGYLSPVA